MVILTGANGLILKTTDNGINWFRLGTGITNILNSICFTDVNRGYAIGTTGKILYTNNGGVSYLDEKFTTSSKYDYYLKQNYPNPFNPQTKISYSIKIACM